MSTICFPQSSLLPDLATKLHICELLHSNSEPPDYLPSTVSALSDELARYDARIEPLREELRQLETARAALQLHYDDCRSLLAPVRRLPFEILAKIFGLFSTEENASPLPSNASETTHPRVEDAGLFRLSQAHLSTLSKVCSRFYTVVMNTPTLWDTIQLHMLSRKIGYRELTMVLLKRVLERGGNCLLNVVIRIEPGMAPHFDALKLLAQHSDRWQTADIFCPSGYLDCLRAKGTLPQLETLRLNCGLWGFLAPRNLVFVLPWNDPFEHLALPSLKELTMVPTQLRFPWQHTQFLALSTRSSFHTHLQSLYLFDSIITETELIECLSILPLLESLAISDHEISADGGPTSQPLVTDSLLAQLTAGQGTPPLIPRLRAFHCRSLLQFDDHVYLNFLLSRVQDGRVFETRLLWLHDDRRELDSIVVERLGELRLRGVLRFSFASGGT
ncbi:hypothetical protein B0H17DRAFT_1069559 [Mycena rosella]|uniref:F-box domain-containing protein n=1 Tax=Mycena rosella TaxID=1033263 RepID=A0AAD7DBP3_MYCRO|nr:hypothetical protein B0H17DRAFT_1069559 [Mycena rosella]